MAKEYGSWCPHCCKGKKEAKTATSIHGSCLECGFQKFPSKYRHSQVRERR